MPTRIAINGFGRIGAAAFRIAIERPELEVVAINGLGSLAMVAHLLKYDSVYGRYDKTVTTEGEDYLVVDGKKYRRFSEKDPTKLPWKDLNVDVVLECTGIFLTRLLASQHLTAGAKHVIISAPAKDSDIGTYVMSVNQADIGKDTISSNASCTTNCIGPVMKVMMDKFGVAKAMMTTIHSYTADQNLVDGTHKNDLRRARGAALNIIPTSTGAAKAFGRTMPSYQGIFDGFALRVPTPAGSISDMTIVLQRDTTVEEVNQALTEAANSLAYKGILAVTTDPIVSSDIIGRPESSIVDLGLTMVVGGNLVKVVSWYDNEFGYANRLVDMAESAGKKLRLPQ
ncbi:MAG: type I glyceraldehyde-3-phosphate dehydrogenase [Candidatus Kerfeldbacteria bacterium]|nr:type I glyceraldehyde-3-phosphate dehydrogenase [Candidatus Kerfeldbacteria bacterium]